MNSQSAKGGEENMPKLDTNAQNMPGHAARNQGGQLRRIRSDTHMETLEERYGVDFGVRDDMEWGTFREQANVNSVREALKRLRQ